MKILLSWLREFVPITIEPRQLAADLSLLGFAVDSLQTIGDETVLELDITTNRPDCLSHYGIARELAAKYRLALTPVEAASAAAADSARPRSRARRKDGPVEIAATDLCSRYSARIIRNVAVRPSPPWLAKRLELAGVRSINNIADATNYVLMAYGHPMHAFDMDKLAGGRIIVRRAVSGEHLTTLDGVDRTLIADDLVIADSKRGVALAGVMGGQDTEITGATRNVLLESAWFDPVAIRRTSKRQGLHTEASHRFERGADVEATLVLANRCIQMIQELAGGELAPLLVDAYPKPLARHPIQLRHWELSRHLGLEIPPEEVERILFGLGFLSRAKGRTGWVCTTPSYRVDVTREIDLVEEVARHYGYDRFPQRLPAGSGQPSHKPPHATKEDRVRSLLLSLGYDETISMPLVSREMAAFGSSAPVPLANPLSEQAAVLRNSMAPGLLSAVQWNLHRGQDSVRLYEIGNIYLRNGSGFREPPVAAFVAAGDHGEAGVDRAPVETTFFDVKGDVEQLLEMFDLPSVHLDAEELPNYYRPGHAARVMANGTTVAQFGQLHPAQAEEWKLRRPVFLAELFLEPLYARGLRSPLAKPLSRFPAVERDFSIILREGTPFDAVRGVIQALQIPELAALRPVEIFRGPSIGANRYSLLVRLTLQSSEATLTEADLSERSSQIIAALERELGATIRMSG
jgi:phenylalanyl-tRNA synthetase beta chain